MEENEGSRDRELEELRNSSGGAGVMRLQLNEGAGAGAAAAGAADAEGAAASGVTDIDFERRGKRPIPRKLRSGK